MPGFALTLAERGRLRPTVDVSALERFLAAIPDEERRGVQLAVVLHFSHGVTMADIRDFLIAVGNDDTAAAVERTMTAQPPVEPGPVTEEPNSPKSELFNMEPPTSPRLRALWDAIEPEQPTSG